MSRVCFGCGGRRICREGNSMKNSISLGKRVVFFRNSEGFRMVFGDYSGI